VWRPDAATDGGSNRFADFISDPSSDDRIPDAEPSLVTNSIPDHARADRITNHGHAHRDAHHARADYVPDHRRPHHWLTHVRPNYRDAHGKPFFVANGITDNCLPHGFSNHRDTHCSPNNVSISVSDHVPQSHQQPNDQQPHKRSNFYVSRLQ
jgi:hypothetical protein